jgi:hypothetical protein
MGCSAISCVINWGVCCAEINDPGVARRWSRGSSSSAAAAATEDHNHEQDKVSVRSLNVKDSASRLESIRATALIAS